MADQKQREVRMSARKRPGNPPRIHLRVHRQMKLMWRAAQDEYARGVDAAFVRMEIPERWHESRRAEAADE